MYKSIYVPVDNSDHSNRAVSCAVGLGKAYSAKLVGCHVYAAKLHDYRFRHVLDDPDIAIGLPGNALAHRADDAVARAADPERADDDQVVL